MSANQSYLSDGIYNYSIVVATTQESINATMKDYLYTTSFDKVQMYWNQDDYGNPVPITKDELLKQTAGTDPLTVANWKQGDTASQDIENISNSNFYFAFEAAIGIPQNVSPEAIPDIITLQENSQSVLFNLLCAEFTIVSCTFGRHGIINFERFSQSDSDFWIFTSQVILKKIEDNSNLSQTVQEKLNNIGPDAFSVQQLLLDLDNAASESTPEISGVDKGTMVYSLLSQVFIGAYFSEMKSKGVPVLSYSFIPKAAPVQSDSTLKISSIAVEVSPYSAPQGTSSDSGLSTLNYLCALNGDTLPPSVEFRWNWVEAADKNNFDGIIAINRNRFATYLDAQIAPAITGNCFKAGVRVWLSGAFKQNVDFDVTLTSAQTPVTTFTPSGSGPIVVSYAYSSSASDRAGLDGDMGQVDITSSYNASITLTGSQIIIHQQIIIYVKARKLQTSVGWNAVDKTLTDTYTLSVDENGKIVVAESSVPTDKAEPIPTDNWFVNLFTDLNQATKAIQNQVNKVIEPGFKDIPLNVVQDFIFPGGKTFVFKDVLFSDEQDLITSVTYTRS
ncbi:hypothetical protein ACMGGR_08030 [Erwinia sp. BNK-24-b]|uniref:hypothetical protein n=1 Tax=unclassified Erwinia TaxID=2622719 RepID=UPI0039BF9E1C